MKILSMKLLTDVINTKPTHFHVECVFKRVFRNPENRTVTFLENGTSSMDLIDVKTGELLPVRLHHVIWGFIEHEVTQISSNYYGPKIKEAERQLEEAERKLEMNKTYAKHHEVI